jgi:hypothetical protein
MKKIRLFYALGLAALLAGCSNILNAPEGPAPKTGTVTLTVGQGSDARTVFPSITQFDEVKLTFAGSPAVADVEAIGGVATINLPVGGPWTVVAEAYIDGVLAAHSTAAHTLSWSGTGDVSVSGGTRFVLEPTDVSGYGTLRGAVGSPAGITLGAGSRITITELSGPSVVFEQDLTESEGLEGDNSMPAGRYSVDVVLVDEETGYTAVYHRTVAILSGLTTEVLFEPGAADFLSEEARAAMTVVENLMFGLTANHVADISLDDEDFVNGNISISAPYGTNTVYFVVSNPDSLILTPINAIWVSDAEGSYSSPYLSIFEVDASAYAAEKEGGEIIVAIAAAAEGKEAIPITVMVTVERDPFGLYVDTGSSLAWVSDEIADLNDAFDWLAANAENNTDYVILMNRDDGLTHYESDPNSEGVTITLRGLSAERTVTYKAGAGEGNGLITVNLGTTFILDEYITLDGEETPLYNEDTNNRGGSALVYVYDGGKFRMKPGSKITNCASIDKGAVYLVGVYEKKRTAEFVMEDGLISGNKGAAVRTNNWYVSFTMEDGEISDNFNSDLLSFVGPNTGAVITGGTYVYFTMRGGKISNNRSRGVSALGNGFNMEGGEISYNGQPTFGGPFAFDTTYTMNNPNSSYVIPGAGIYSSGTFTITGGSIINNGAADALSSGIFFPSGRVTLNGPVVISGNSIDVSYVTNNNGNIRSRYPLNLGPEFSNEADGPIVVNIASDPYYPHYDLDFMKETWGSNPCIVLMTGQEDKIAEFAPGVAVAFRSSISPPTFIKYTAPFIFGSNGSIVWL